MPHVLIVDDHPIVLQGCRRVLEDLGFCEIREANSLVSAYRHFRKIKPDLVILDLGLDGRSLCGIDLIQRMRMDERRFGILVFSMHGDPIIVRRALDAGATGYIIKDSDPADLREAIGHVRKGQTYLSHSLAVELALLGTRKKPDLLDNLTPREVQILSLLAEGNQYGEIADKLSISYKTVSNSCSQMKIKLGATTLPKLIGIAVRLIGSRGGEARAEPPRYEADSF